jgi:hypothetical protein
MSPMNDSLFVRDGDAYLPTETARGPWSPDALHGGPVAGLLSRGVEAHDGGEAMTVARLTVELLRPVPVAPLTLSTTTLRPGRKVQLVGASLHADGAEVARAVALRIRVAEVDLPADLRQADEPVPPFPTEPSDATAEAASSIPWRAFAPDGIELRNPRGAGLGTLGPKTVWFRLRQSLVDAETPSALVRVACASDFGNGVSAALPWEGWVFINPDLTIYLHRPLVGEWVALEAKTNLEPIGVGMAESRLYDRSGPIGRAVQSLLVDRR